MAKKNTNLLPRDHRILPLSPCEEQKSKASLDPTEVAHGLKVSRSSNSGATAHTANNTQLLASYGLAAV